MSENRDSNGMLRDAVNQPYQSPDNRPAGNGTTVTIPNGSGGSQQGTMVGGIVVPNTQK